MSRMRTARFLGPVAALLLISLGGASEAHAWTGLGIDDLVVTSMHSTLNSCVTGFSVLGGSAGGGEACPGSWAFDLLALGFIFSTVVVIVRMRLRAEGNRLELARRFIERGMEPPGSLFPSAARADLRRGVILLFAGLGFLVTDYGGGDHGPVGLIPGFIGLGYLVSYALSQRLSVRKSEGEKSAHL